MFEQQCQPVSPGLKFDCLVIEKVIHHIPESRSFKVLWTQNYQKQNKANLGDRKYLHVPVSYIY